jgi:hypothetical protein
MTCQTPRIRSAQRARCPIGLGAERDQARPGRQTRFAPSEGWANCRFSALEILRPVAEARCSRDRRRRPRHHGNCVRIIVVVLGSSAHRVLIQPWTAVKTRAKSVRAPRPATPSKPSAAIEAAGRFVPVELRLRASGGVRRASRRPHRAVRCPVEALELTAGVEPCWLVREPCPGVAACYALDPRRSLLPLIVGIGVAECRVLRREASTRDES